jgi:hypothetical protein
MTLVVKPSAISGCWDKTHSRWTTQDGKFVAIRKSPTPSEPGCWRVMKVTLGRAYLVKEVKYFSQARAAIVALVRGGNQ